MSRLIWWTVAIIAATVIFVGIPAAKSLRNTVATTAGVTGGLVVGGVPNFVNSFKTGMSQGPGGNGQTGGTAWNVAPTAPALKIPAAPASKPTTGKLHA